MGDATQVDVYRTGQARERATAALVAELAATVAPRDNRLVDRLLGRDNAAAGWMMAAVVLFLPTLSLLLFVAADSRITARVAATAMVLVTFARLLWSERRRYARRARLARHGELVMAPLAVTSSGYRVELPVGTVTSLDAVLAPRPAVLPVFVLATGRRRACMVVLPDGSLRVLDLPRVRALPPARLLPRRTA